MKNIAISLFVLLTISLIVGCEGGTTFTKRIENNSNDEITIKLYTIYGPTESHTILPNESKLIYWDDQMGVFVGNSYTCTQIIDSAEVNISVNKSLIKDILDPNNWNRISKDGRNSKEECTFVISPNDIQ